MSLATPASLPRAALAAAVVGCALLIPTALSWPLGWDQGIFAWVANVIQGGGLPYRDAWDLKGPLAYYPVAAAQLLFGPHAWSIRALDILFVVLGGVAVARLVSRLAAPAAARWAVLLFVYWYASGSYWHTAQPDGWAGILVLVGLAPLLANADDGRRQAFAGALIGAAAMIKPLYALFLVVPALGLFVTGSPGWSRRVRLLAGLGSGFVAIVAAGVAWFAAHGAARDFWDAYVGYAVASYSTAAPEGRLRGAAEYLLAGKVIVLAAPLAIVGLQAVAGSRPAQFMLGSWVGCAVALVMAQNRYYEYHWLPLLPPLTVLTVVGLAAVFRAQPAGAARALAWVLAAAIAVHAVAHPAFDVGRWLAHATGRTGSAAYYDLFNQSGNERRVAQLISEATQPGDRVVVFGWNAGVLFLSHRSSPTRFGFSMPLLLGEQSPTRQRLRREFIACVRARPPSFIVVGEQADLILGRTYSVADFPEFRDFLAAGYREEARFGLLAAYRRVASAGEPSGPPGAGCR